MSDAARRLFLYGGAALALWAASRVHAVLLVSASREPYPGPRVEEQALGPRTFEKALREMGCDAKEAPRLARAAGAELDMERLSPRSRLRLVRRDDGSLAHLTFTAGARRVLVLPEGSGLRALSRMDPVAETARMATGEVRGSLWASMSAAGVPAEAVMGFAEAFRWTVDFLTETRNGDRFAIAWTERSAGGRVLERVVGAGAYKGRAAGSRTAVLFDGEYYDAAGESLRRRFLRAPLKFSRVSSRFNPRRRHPILRINRPHHGTDYAAPRGTPVSAVADGVVVSARRERGFGNVVKIRHDATYTTLYAHLSRFAAGLRPGKRVNQGKVIGYVGSTGLATGPHLHFQIEKNGRWADFLALDLPFARSVPRARRAAFQSALDRYRPELVLAPETTGRSSVRSSSGG